MADRIKFRKNNTGSDYEPTDSEEEYSEEEKELLQEVRKGRERKNEGRKELMAFADSDDEDDDDDDDNDGNQDENDDDDDDMDDLMHDSDIEGGAGDDDNDADMPNEMDWGTKSRNYYNTDFIDPDFSSYTPEQLEQAKEEEEEAKAIQLRLAKEMTENDFQLDKSLLEKVKKNKKLEESAQSAITTTKIKADFSGLSTRDKQQLFQKDSPEFLPLVTDFKGYLKEVESLQNPVLDYVKTHDLPMIPAFEFAQVYRSIALTYCSNISFYLLLKTKRISVRNHPVVKRLSQFKNLLLELEDKYKNIIRPQLEALLERIQDGDEFEVLPIKPVLPKTIASVANKKSSKLSILDKYAKDTKAKKNGLAPTNEDELEDDRVGGVMDSSDDEEAELSADENEDEAGSDELEDEEGRRGITYEIAKNKGLTPHRKKEMRNPRVKHRNRFRKALIRRKGAVRTVRKETKRYGGEISGIKATVSKSVKFKS